MNASLSLSGISGPIEKFFSKYHATIFFTVITLFLAGAIFSLYSASNTTGTPSSSPIATSTFDTSTEVKIKELKSRDESKANLVFPTPRSNPFVE